MEAEARAYLRRCRRDMGEMQARSRGDGGEMVARSRGDGGGGEGRCGEMWGDEGRCGEMWGDPSHGADEQRGRVLAHARRDHRRRRRRLQHRDRRLLLERLDQLLATLQVVVERLHRADDVLPAGRTANGTRTSRRRRAHRERASARPTAGRATTRWAEERRSAHILFFFVRLSSCAHAHDAHAGGRGARQSHAPV